MSTAHAAAAEADGHACLLYTSFWALMAGTAITVLLVSGSFLVIARIFKILCAALLAYVGVLFFIKVPWGRVALYTLSPHLQLSKVYIALLVGCLLYTSRCV